MLIADTYVGSLDDPDVAARVASVDPLCVVVDDADRRRSRVRTTATDGTDLGIVVGRELRDGDVLATRDDDRTAGGDDVAGAEKGTDVHTLDGERRRRLVVVELDGVPAIEISFETVDGVTRKTLTTAVELGHAVGNRHLELAVQNGRVFVSAQRDVDRLRALIDDHAPSGTTIERTTVSPATFDRAAVHGHTHPGSDRS